MSETEKITINLGPVDLGRIDVLVEQGLYSNRTDLIRTAIRNLLDRHDTVVKEHAARWSFVIGAEVVRRSALEKLREEGKQASFRVIGSLTLSKDIDADLALATIQSISIRGSFRAAPEVRE